MTMQIKDGVAVLDRINIILSDLYLAETELEQAKVIPAWKRLVAAKEHLTGVRDDLKVTFVGTK